MESISHEARNLVHSCTFDLVFASSPGTRCSVKKKSHFVRSASEHFHQVRHTGSCRKGVQFRWATLVNRRVCHSTAMERPRQSGQYFLETKAIFLCLQVHQTILFPAIVPTVIRYWSFFCYEVVDPSASYYRDTVDRHVFFGYATTVRWCRLLYKQPPSIIFCSLANGILSHFSLLCQALVLFSCRPFYVDGSFWIFF